MTDNCTRRNKRLGKWKILKIQKKWTWYKGVKGKWQILKLDKDDNVQRIEVPEEKTKVEIRTNIKRDNSRKTFREK